MENAYGIGVKNRYDLFYNDDVDPFEILERQEVEKQRRKTEKGTVKEKPKSVTKQGKASPATAPVKKGKETVPATTPKPTEAPEAQIKPRTRTNGGFKPKISSDEVKDIEEKKNFRNREDQHANSEQSSNFQRNTTVKRGNQESFYQRERGDDFRRGRGGGSGFRGRGRGGGRGGRGGFSNFEGGRKRDFDRHSGSDKTGIRHVDKREGSGTGNWGSVKDDIKDQADIWDDTKDASFEQSPKKEDETWGDAPEDMGVEVDKPTSDVAEPTGAGDEPSAENTDSKENVPVDDEAVEEAAREMTLDEWKREQEAKRAVPKYNLRKPGEGEDSSQWKKTYMLKKKAKEDDDDEEEEEEEEPDDEEFGRRGRQRQLIDIQINFNDSRRGRGGRGRGGRGAGPRSSMPSGPREDRGGGGGGGMGGPSTPGERGSRMNRGPAKMKTQQQSAPRVDDWNDFPSLVTA